jgi:hypothetical protein
MTPVTPLPKAEGGAKPPKRFRKVRKYVKRTGY